MTEKRSPGLRHPAINKIVVGPLGLSEQPTCHHMAHQDTTFCWPTHCSNTSSVSGGSKGRCRDARTAWLPAPSPMQADYDQPQLLTAMLLLTGCIQPTVTHSCILFSIT